MTETNIPRRPGRRRVRRAIFFILLVAVAVIFRRPLFFGNFGVVDPGKVFRSAQPEAGLEANIRQRGLGAVVNLRGGTDFDGFYRHEVDVTESLGVEFYDLPVSATRRPKRRDLMLLLGVLDRCRYPLLIHCKWGSDRTALMSALYRMVVRGEPPEAVLDEFSLAHGHFPIFGPEHLHEPIDEYARFLRDRGLRHDPARFRLWLERDYAADDPFTGWPTIEPGRRPRKMAANRDPDRR